MEFEDLFDYGSLQIERDGGVALKIKADLQEEWHLNQSNHAKVERDLL